MKPTDIGQPEYFHKVVDCQWACPAHTPVPEYIRLIAQGLSAPEIGARIHLSTATVKTHLQHLYEKLGVSERAAAVAEGMRRGLLD